ncbi:MAG: efflux RND transporter permease subunit [Gemmatimonadetes bacterium]|nr:efflux RND transporter permease subunit [Gemmatimonadota bacterium]
MQRKLTTAADVDAAVREGALERLRPVMMTVTAIIAGLAPIMWGSGAGADVMKRVAAPMVGGMVTATVLTLVVIPAFYLLWRRWEVRRRLSVPAAVSPLNLQPPFRQSSAPTDQTSPLNRTGAHPL